MSIAEVLRKLKSFERTEKRRLREQVQLNWELANLIGVSINRLFSAEAEYPSIEKCYPNLFTEEEIEDRQSQKQDERSIANFMAFAAAHNLKRQKMEVE